MRNIPIEPIPNQSLTITENGTRFGLVIKDCNQTIAVDVSIDDVAVLQGQRIVVGTPIIPYEYLAGSGNFILLVNNDELPDYTKFGMSQLLMYTEPGEVVL